MAFSIKERLLALDHDVRDIESAEWGLWGTTPLTETGTTTTRSPSESINKLTSAWLRIRKRVEASVDTAKRHRLEEVRRVLVLKRWEILENAYRQFRTSRPSGEWASMPPIDWIGALPEYEAILEADSDVIVAEGAFDKLVPNLPKVIPEVTKTMRNHARGLMKTSKVVKTVRGGPDILDLAVAVFSCSRCDGPMYGFAGISLHRCLAGIRRRCLPKWDLLQFQDSGAQIISALLEAIGKDPRRTTIDEMDTLDARFVSSYSKLYNRHRGNIIYRVFTWRRTVRTTSSTWRFKDINIYDKIYDQVVGSYSDHVTKAHAKPSNWRMLTQEELVTYQSQEIVMIQAVDAWAHRWSCGRCTEYLDTWDTKLVVRSHLAQV